MSLRSLVTLAVLGPFALFASASSLLRRDVSLDSTTNQNKTVAAAQACAKLTTAFPDKLFAAGTTQFQNQSLAIWSETCLITPSCVFLPSSAQDISRALSIIRSAGSPFSVRSGGHMPVPGAQSVSPGVFISMSALNQKTINRAAGTVSIGPGQTWLEVYNYLAPYGIAVNGGRFPSVGVGGVLIGGGIGYFASTQGWGCDNVVTYEAVLADGTIVEAKQTGPWADLFWALRGGHNNFAIVTRFDVRSFPATSAFAKVVSWNASSPGTSDAFFNALGAYVSPGGGVDDPSVAILPTVAAAPSLGVVQVITDQFKLGTDPSPAAFANFSKIPAASVLQQVGGQVFPSWTQMPQFLASTASRDLRQIFYSVSFKADPRAISIANRTVMDLTFAAPMANAANALVALTFQPISQNWLKQSAIRGGNALGLDPKMGTFIAAIIAVQWTDAKDDATVNQFCADATAKIKAQTKPLGLDVDFIYLNDAGAAQRPFASYGHNLPILQAIRAKYDPFGFYKNNLAHGFTLDA